MQSCNIWEYTRSDKRNNENKRQNLQTINKTYKRQNIENKVQEEKEKEKEKDKRKVQVHETKLNMIFSRFKFL